MESSLLTQNLPNGDSYTLKTYSSETSTIKELSKWSFTVLMLPISIPLKCLQFAAMATPLHNLLLGFFLPKVMKMLDKRLKKYRSELLRNMQGRILDVGAGSGEYVQYYASQATQMVAVEPVTRLHDTILEKDSSVRIYRYLEDVIRAEEEPFDWILLGNVLCEVDDVTDTLHQVQKILKKDGHVYFSEHIAASRQSWTRWWQEWYNPVWKVCMGGCNCNRESLRLLQERFTVIHWTTDMKVVGGPLVAGLAVLSTPE